MVEAFILQKGVTKCPSFGTRELAQLHIDRDLAAANADSYKFGGWNRKRKRKS